MFLQPSVLPGLASAKNMHVCGFGLVHPLLAAVILQGHIRSQSVLGIKVTTCYATEEPRALSSAFPWLYSSTDLSQGILQVLYPAGQGYK